jgi:hypothetical protein
MVAETAWERLNRNLGRPGVGNALGLLSAALLRGGARTTDLGAGPRGAAAAFEAFTKGMRQAREDEERRRRLKLQEKFQTAQLGEIEAKTAERERTLAGEEAMYRTLGSPWPHPDTGKILTSFDTPPSMDIAGFERADASQPQDLTSGGQWDVYANMTPIQRQIVAAQAQADPMAASKTLAGFQKEGAKAPTMTSWYGPKGLDQKGYWDNGKWVSVGGPKAASTSSRGTYAQLQDGLASAQQALAADPDNPRLQKLVTNYEGVIRKASEWEPDSGTAADDPETSKKEWRIRLPGKDGQLGAQVTSWWDPTKKQRFYRDPDTQEIKIKPKDANFITPTSTGKEIMSRDSMLKLSSDVTQARSGVRQLAEYMETVKGYGEYGLDLLASNWIGTIKTAFGGIPTLEQLNAMEDSGELRQILGPLRIQLTGGGVMSDFDVKNIIMALGGASQATRHPEIVRRLLRKIVTTKIEDYNKTLLPMYNDQAVRGGVYEQEAPLEMPAIFDKPLIDFNAPSGWTLEEWNELNEKEKAKVLQGRLSQ